VASQERHSPGTAGADLVPLSGDSKAAWWGLVSGIYRAVETLIGLLEGRLTLGTAEHASWTGHVDGQYHVVLTDTADFATPHGLGRLPVGYVVVRSDADVRVFDSPTNAHTDTILWLRASSAGATATLMVW
jgi:hypothetical protein